MARNYYLRLSAFCYSFLSCIKSKDAMVCLPVSFPNSQMYTHSKMGRQISATTSPIKSAFSKVYPIIAIIKVAIMLPTSKITPIKAPIRFILSFISEVLAFCLKFMFPKSIAQNFLNVKIKV